MTDKQILDFIEARVMRLENTDGWPTKRLEYASDAGTLLSVEGADIREMVSEACASTRWAGSAMPGSC